LKVFDSLTREKLDMVKTGLFAACSGLQGGQLNISPSVVDVLCAYLLKGFPELKAMQPGSPLVWRVEGVLRNADVEYEELLAWATHLALEVGASKEVEKKMQPQDVALLKAQAAVLDEMVGVTRTLSLRLKEVEAQLNSATNKRHRKEATSDDPPTDPSDDVEMEAPDKKKRKQSPRVRLIDVWYEWYAVMGYLTPEPSKDAKKNHVERKVVSFMRLFAGSYTLDNTAAGYRDSVLSVGNAAAESVAIFFAENNITARSSGTALKAFRALHKAGKLDSRIVAYKIRVASKLLTNPTPMSKRCILDPVVFDASL